MLEKIGTEGYRTLSRANRHVLTAARQMIEECPAGLRYAELGVGVGATTIEVAKILDNRGQIHIFDFEKSVDELKADLASHGFRNVAAHGNTEKYWDSYNWELSKLVTEAMGEPLFDLIYIDGAHTLLHDALAFFLCDRLLASRGLIVFDDYEWSFSISTYMQGRRSKFMTDEQIEAKQIKMVVDGLVKTHPGYVEVTQNNVYRKVA